MSYLDKDTDVTRYQGQAFNWIGFDELTQWSSPYAWDYMRSRLRSAHSKDLGLYMSNNKPRRKQDMLGLRKCLLTLKEQVKPFWATNIETR